MTDTDTNIFCQDNVCNTVVAEDIFDGWIRTFGEIFIDPRTGDAFCQMHGKLDTDQIVSGEVKVA